MTPAALAALHAVAFSTPRPWRADEFEDYLADPTCDLARAPDGFCLIRTIADEAELLTIAVHPEQRRRGLATGLLMQGLMRARARGALTLFLEVAADNTGAIAFYEKAGFSRSGRRREYYTCPDGTRVDALLMARNLSDLAVKIPESG